jgi:hypothetical protein
MNQTPESLIYDLVEWVARAPRPYAEAIDAWRTSCPRLTVWEDATDRGLIARQPSDRTVVATAKGEAFLQAVRAEKSRASAGSHA